MSKALFVALLSSAMLVNGCCSMGKNKTSWETTDTTGDAVVEVTAKGADGKPLPGVVRQGPGSNYPQITTLQSGTWVSVLDNTKTETGYWSYVRWSANSGGEGWMHQDILNKKPPSKSAAPANNTNIAKDGLPETIPPPSSSPPSLTEWNAVTKEITVKNSSALGCETKMIREWLRVSCRPRGKITPLEAKITSTSGQQAYKWNSTGQVASIVVQVIQGKSFQGEFSFSEDPGRHFGSTLSVNWPSSSARPVISFSNAP